MREFATVKKQRFKKTTARRQDFGGCASGWWYAAKLLEFAPATPSALLSSLLPFLADIDPLSSCVLKISLRIIMVFSIVTVTIALHAVCSCHHPLCSSYPLMRLQERKHICGMIGHGVNDAPALRRAEIGIAVADATDAARSASDIVFTKPGLSVIISAVLTSRAIFHIFVQNLNTKHPISTRACIFGDIKVPAEIIQDGVICCEAPSHLLGKVTLCITFGD
ncbi:hypothetical protein S245_012939 [Arachis hypogaea]